MRLIRRSFMALLLASIAYVLVLAFPQPLFAYELRHANITIHSTRPIPGEMGATLQRVHSRLQRSPLFDANRSSDVFLCHPQWLFAVFARQNYRVGGIADGFVGQHVFLRDSDMRNDRLISPTGTPVAADRPLSYFVAHELMHIATVRHVGRQRYARLPQWVDDGYADYFARDIDFAQALQKMKADARELDPRRSGLYLRYHLMVAYLIEKKGMRVEGLMAAPPDREAVERELLSLTEWPSS